VLRDESWPPGQAASCTQQAVEAVGRRVAWTLHRLARAGSVRHHVSAVAADVQEGPQLAVSRACDHNRDLAGRRGEEPALGNLPRVAYVLPGPGEDALPLAPEDVRIRVPRPMQGPLHGENCSVLGMAQARISLTMPCRAPSKERASRAPTIRGIRGGRWRQQRRLA